MNIEIRKLSPELLEDYLNFFDNVAFTDHKEWSGCYCVEPHMHNKQFEENLPRGKLSKSRDYAIDFVKRGKLQGYLAYSNGEVVGWCNANNKQNYERLKTWKDVCFNDDGPKRIKSIMCFAIAPDMRGKGIATALLEQICNDSIEKVMILSKYIHTKASRIHIIVLPDLLQCIKNKGFQHYRKLSMFG
ncbi:hypothetical protein FACS18948_2100 [Clostridia bacterium]|nr:hypothetical protein FACS18948_2100 [Clostridia bacterium]